MDRRRAILACLILALCLTPFLFWEPDWERLAGLAEEGATLVAEEVGDVFSTKTPSPTNTLGPTPTRTATPIPSPTRTATPPPIPPTATPLPRGHGRAEPYALGELVRAPNWDVRVVDSVRGETAWEMLLEANSYNTPAPEGFEYILVKLHVRCAYTDDAPHEIGAGDFDLTGDRMVRYGLTSVVEPDPVLDAELYQGGELTGWVAFAAGAGEGNLILVVDELANRDRDAERFLAVDADASLTVDPALAEIRPDTLGSSHDAPATFGETVTTDDWRVSVLEVVRGEAAWELALAANQFNAPPAEGMEYVAIRLDTQRIDADERAVRVDEFACKVTGEHKTLYDVPTVVEPAPAFAAYLYPGGSVVGWAVQQCRVGEAGLMLYWAPRGADEGDRRYLALE